MLQIFSPLILWVRLALWTNSTTLSLERPHYEMSKKSERVFLLNCKYIFSGSFSSSSLSFSTRQLWSFMLLFSSFPLAFLTNFPGDRKAPNYETGLLPDGVLGVRMRGFLRTAVLVWVSILGLSFSMLRTALTYVYLLFGVLINNSFSFRTNLEEEGIESMSTSKLVLFCKKELVPKTIYDFVQSKNGFIRQSYPSFTSTWPVKSFLTTFAQRWNQDLLSSNTTFTSEID